MRRLFHFHSISCRRGLFTVTVTLVFTGIFLFHIRLQSLSHGTWSSLNSITKFCVISVKFSGVFSKWGLWPRTSESKGFSYPKSFTRDARTRCSLVTPSKYVTQNYKLIFQLITHLTFINCMALSVLWKVTSFKSELGYDSSKRFLLQKFSLRTFLRFVF